jgi:ribosomal protein S18 acetylase RimI-like enzyme
VLIVTRTLEMLAPPAYPDRALPDGVRIERVEELSPEYARFLYALVGGPWSWNDRLPWTRGRWEEDLAVPGTETSVLYGGGAPLGYVQIQPAPHHDGAHVEIRYLGLVHRAFGRGWGAALLEHGVHAAWTLPRRHALPPVTRVWVHTCTLDGPAALANYEARGFVEVGRETTEIPPPCGPALGPWRATTGSVPR